MLLLQIFIGADSEYSFLQSKKEWKHPRTPVEIIIHYKYGFFRDEVYKKPKKVTKVREGIKKIHNKSLFTF